MDGETRTDADSNLNNTLIDGTQQFSTEATMEWFVRVLTEQNNASTSNAPHPVPMEFPPSLPLNCTIGVVQIPQISLKNSEIFKMFYQVKNEMFVMSNGRTLFPIPEYTVSNLIQNETYAFGIKLRVLDNSFMKYENGRWESSRHLIHSQEDTNEIFSPNKLGIDWMKDGVRFRRLKIFNIGYRKSTENALKKEADSENMIKVQPMARYIPILTMYQVTDPKIRQPFAEYSFEETKFVVVTKYRNKEVIKLKKQENEMVRADYRKPASDADKEQEPSV